MYDEGDKYFIAIIKSALALNDAPDVSAAHAAFSSIVLNAKYMTVEKYGELTGRDISDLRELLHDVGVQALGGL